MTQRYDLVIQLGSQVQYVDGQYQLAPHTWMRTMASAIILKTGISPRLMISGGSNFGVRYNDTEILKPPVFSFEAFADADFQRKVEIMLKRRPMFTGSEKIAILTLLYHMEKALPVFRSAGLNVEPLFAENVLADNDPTQIDSVCEYYSTPKGGKQYPVDRIRQLLTNRQSLTPLMA